MNLTNDELNEIVNELGHREARRTQVLLLGALIGELIVLGSMFVYFNLMHGYL